MKEDHDHCLPPFSLCRISNEQDKITAFCIKNIPYVISALWTNLKYQGDENTQVEIYGLGIKQAPVTGVKYMTDKKTGTNKFRWKFL